MGIRKIHLFVFLFLATSCEQPEASDDVSSSEEALFFECGNGIRYPTTEMDFATLYNHRGFGAPSARFGAHLGHDILYPEGAAIHPIACGRVVYYSHASGYGSLVVVIEHTLSHEITVHNALNHPVTIDRFLTIYGHLRPTRERRFARARTVEDLRESGGTPLAERVWAASDGNPRNYASYSGDNVVYPDDVIGYIEYHEYPDTRSNPRNLNGDGDLHLHFGVRLQSFREAGTGFMAGYDGHNRERQRPYADPAIFMAEILNTAPVLWHPRGSFLVNRDNHDEAYLVVGDSHIVRVDPAFRALERLDRYALFVSRAELDCYRRYEWIFPPYDGTALTDLVRFDGDSAVYELHDVGSYRYTFISWEAFLSWGRTDSDIRRLPAGERSSVLGRYADHGFRRMRPGSLVSARGESEVAFVTGSERLPFFNWDTFVAMGFEHQTIYEIDPSVIDAVAYPRGGAITPEIARLCRVPSCSGSRCAGAGTAGGGGIDVDAGMTTPPMPSSDAGMPPMPDAGSPSPPPMEPDAGTPMPDAGTDSGAVPSSTDPGRVRITLSSSLHGGCPGGYVMNLWGAGTVLTSEPGRTLEGSVAGWSGWSGLTLTCPTGGWHDWSPDAGRSANAAGVESIYVGDTEISANTLICVEPWNPSGGYRPVISWDPVGRGRCP